MEMKKPCIPAKTSELHKMSLIASWPCLQHLISWISVGFGNFNLTIWSRAAVMALASTTSFPPHTDLILPKITSMGLLFNSFVRTQLTPCSRRNCVVSTVDFVVKSKAWYVSLGSPSLTNVMEFCIFSM